MAEAAKLILGEFQRTLDERYRLSIPSELVDRGLEQSGGASQLPYASDGELVLAKECPGALSLWVAAQWQERLQADVQLIESKLQARRLQERTSDVQRLGRLLSTRHTTVQIVGRSRLLIPEGFREFLGVPPNGPVVVIGAALCVEIWRPAAWLAYLDDQIPQFRQLMDDLSA